MHIEPDCIACIFNQALRVTKALELSPEASKQLLDEAACMLPSFSLDLTPPQNATPMYEKFSLILGREDIYAQQKKEAIAKAESLLPYCQKHISQSSDPLVTAAKIAVAGNVIDLASEYEYDLEEEIAGVLDATFAIDQIAELTQRIAKSDTIVYLADNAGENVFDRLYMQTIKAHYPDTKIYYFVRSRPIINDICVKDLENDPVHEVATVVDSGVHTPGIVVDALGEEAKRLFFSAGCIISKGMGNYECLSDCKVDSLYYLLKVKCQVVARSLSLQPGDLVCKSAH
ncbi:MAG: hypothetical protein DSZ05_09390 [Sulfurospirillum sp.]|nr:MAG: hypothetical protein DSZ05_09390 [Sulfurospirillum sp.]